MPPAYCLCKQKGGRGTCINHLQRISKPECLIFTEGSICNRPDIHNAIEATVSKFGKLDSVIANAGIHRKNTLLNITDEELDLMIQTNIYGTVNTLREAVPHIINAGVAG